VAANSTPTTEDGQMLVFNEFTIGGAGSGFNIGYIGGVLTAWQNLDPTVTGFARVTNISPTTLNISAFGAPELPLYSLTAV
jgi:hypothetical protein